jgi:hypothetical protein
MARASLRAKQGHRRVLAASHRGFQRGGQGRVGPVAGQRQVGERQAGRDGARAGAVARRGAAFLDGAAGGRRLGPGAGEGEGAGEAADLGPGAGGEGIGGFLALGVGGADGDGDAGGTHQHPLAEPAEQAEETHRRLGRAGEMQVEDGGEGVGRLGAGEEAGGLPGRQGQDRALAGGEGEVAVGEVQRGGAGGVHGHAAQPRAEAGGDAAGGEGGQSRGDHVRPEALARHQQAPRARQRGAAQHGAEECRRGFGDRRVQRGDGERLDEAAQEARMGGEAGGERRVAAGEREAEQGKDAPGGEAVGRMAAEPAAGGERHVAGAAVGEVEHGEPVRLRLHPGPARADAGEEGKRGAVGGEQGVGAVVGAVGQGAGAAAGRGRGIVQRDGHAAFGQKQGGGEAGDAGADHMGEAAGVGREGAGARRRHHGVARRSAKAAMRAFSPGLRRGRARGGPKPRAVRRASSRL